MVRLVRREALCGEVGAKGDGEELVMTSHMPHPLPPPPWPTLSRGSHRSTTTSFMVIVLLLISTTSRDSDTTMPLGKTKRRAIAMKEVTVLRCGKGGVMELVRRRWGR